MACALQQRISSIASPRGESRVESPCRERMTGVQALMPSRQFVASHYAAASCRCGCMSTEMSAGRANYPPSHATPATDLYGGTSTKL